MKLLSNILLVSGSGRNTGKTSFACSVINHFSNELDLCAVKISSHIHELDYEMIEIFNSKDYRIFKEENRNDTKDSSRMLQAGAKSVYYIQSKKATTGEAFIKLMDFIPHYIAIVCESGGLSNFYKPGVHFHLISGTSELLQVKDHNKQIVNFKGEGFNFNLNNLEFNSKAWVLTKK